MKSLEMSEGTRLLFLLIYPLNTAASQRFRFEQYFPFLNEKGFFYSINCFYDKKTFEALYNEGGRWKLAIRMLACFFRRCWFITTLMKYDCILIQRGVSPFGPPVFEWIIRFVYRKPIIYDFDDAIWLQPERKTSFFNKWVKAYYKVKQICRWSHTVVAGNKYLAAYASNYSKNVVIIPTVVDTEVRFVPHPREPKINAIIGWTGSHTTLVYLEALEPVLYQLQKKYGFELLVIANKPPNLSQVNFCFVPWSEEAEVAALRKIDIGIMPLPDDEWTKGKCGFKAIQYMALAKPAVASAVGVNKEIIDDALNGFLCANNEDWATRLSYLLEHPEEVKEFGERARQKIEQKFSLKKAVDEWSAVLRSV